ncbi:MULTISPECIES: aminoglycoside phosphotransferase family protein [Helcococcus]|uniref:Phosphotransferase n=2 Tax=Helcococcus bovis TaxID=3153252 RepID=A0ABW9F7C1_9FIRM
MKEIEKLYLRHNIISSVELLKGWSKDKKYILTSSNSEKFILRLTSSDYFMERKRQFNILKKVSKLNINTTKAVDFGYLEDGTVYMLLTYLPGEEGLDYIKKVSDEEAYKLGIQAGKILKKLHQIKIKRPEISWKDRYDVKAEIKINNILNCKYKIKYLDKLIKYYKDNIHLMENRPIKFSHGDFHLGNMIINDNKIGIIDFEKSTIADPYDDLKPFRWNVFGNAYFETGLINAYFSNNIPKNFFEILKFYSVEAMISQLPWALNYGQEEIDMAYYMIEKQMEWLEVLDLIVPTWYKGIIKKFE